MTTSIALVRSDMKNAITLHAPPSPIPEEPAIKTNHVISFWDPWHELGLYDPIQNMMPCMGRVLSRNGAPCQSEAPIDKSADLKAVLIRIASKMPQDVNDLDLNQLLDLGTCNAHQNDSAEVKSHGLKALHYRLNIARMHYERLERFVDEIRTLRIHIHQMQSSTATSDDATAIVNQDVVVNQLRMRIDQLEQDNVTARMETEKVEADGIDREAKLDRDVQERDEKIEDLQQELSDAKIRHDLERTKLDRRVHDAEMTINTLEEQQEIHAGEVKDLRAELETRKQSFWRRKLRKWLRREK